MSDVYSIRHRHLLTLLSRIPGRAKVKLLAHATGTAPGHVSQMRNKTRTVGEAVARRIEARLGLPYECLDREDELPAIGQAPIRQAATVIAALSPKEELLLELWSHLTSGQKKEVLRDLRARVETNDMILKELKRPFDNVSDERIESAFGATNRLPAPKDIKPQ